MYVDFKGKVGEPNTDALISALKKKCRHTLVLDSKEVPWFPRHISQLDLIANRTLDAGKCFVMRAPLCLTCGVDAPSDMHLSFSITRHHSLSCLVCVM